MLNVGSKLYTNILNKCLTQWTENNKLLNEAQAGFRQGYIVQLTMCSRS